MASDPILRLHSSFAFFAVTESAIELSSNVKNKRFRIDGCRADVLIDAFKVLAEGVSAHAAVDQLAKRACVSPCDARYVLDHLRAADALVERRTDDEALLDDPTTLYDRQIRFFQLFEDDQFSGVQFNERLQKRKILLAGVGGLGGWVALMCDRLGINNIVVVDPDTVELSNLHRQIVYESSDIGKLKVVACEERLGRISSNVQIEGHPINITKADALKSLLCGCDFVFNPFGYVPHFEEVAHAVAKAAASASVPCLTFSSGLVGPLTVPGKSACYRCASKILEQQISLSSLMRAGTPIASRRSGSEFLPAVAPRQAIAAGIAVWECVKFLSGIQRPRTLDGAIYVDTSDWERHTFHTMVPASDCDVCSSVTTGGFEDLRQP